jgi:hypothetical protein
MPQDRYEEILDFPFFSQSVGQAFPVSSPPFSIGLMSENYIPKEVIKDYVS